MDIEDLSMSNLDQESTERRLRSRRFVTTDNIRYAFRRMGKKKPTTLDRKEKEEERLRVKYKTEEKTKCVPYYSEDEDLILSKTTYKPVKRNSNFTYKPFKFSRSPYNPDMNFIKKKCAKISKDMDNVGGLNLNISTEEHSFKTLLENVIRFNTTSTIKSPIERQEIMFPTKTTEESLRNDFNIEEMTREIGFDPSYLDLGTRIDTFLPLDSSKIESTFSSFSYSKPTTVRDIKDFQNHQNLNLERLNTITQNEDFSSDRTNLDAKNAIAFEFFKIKRKRSLENEQKENMSNLFYVLDSGRTEQDAKPNRTPSRYSRGAKAEDNKPANMMRKSMPDFLRIKRFSLATKKLRKKQKENQAKKKRSMTNKKEKKEKRRKRNRSLQRSLTSTSFFPKLEPVPKKSVVEKDYDFKVMEQAYQQSKTRLKQLSQTLFNTNFMGAFEDLKPLDDDISVKEYINRGMLV